MREGEYTFSRAFLLTQEDSGTETRRIKYCGYPGENVSIMGGKNISSTLFRLVDSEEVLNRLPGSARGKVYQAELSSGPLSFIDDQSELFINGQAMTLARYPNSTYLLTGEIVRLGDVPRLWEDDLLGSPNYVPPEQRNNPPIGPIFKCADNKPYAWDNDSNIMMYGYWFYDWAPSAMKVREINGLDQTITGEPPNTYGIRTNQRYYFYNVFEELDSHGEYYIDKQNKILYVYTDIPIVDCDIKISVLKDNLVTMENVSNITFDNITFGLGLRDGVYIVGGQNNLINNSTFKLLRGRAVTIGDKNIAVTPLISGGANNGIRNCEIFDTGQGGILINGGDRYTLSPAGNFVENCNIYRTDRLQKDGGQAIRLFGVGNRAVHNEIHQIAYNAILFAGNDNLIEYNNIYNVITETQDAGAIAAGRNFTFRGNVIRYNYIHDIKPFSGAGENVVFGVYLDDLLSGTEVIGNVFANVDVGVMINGGRDNVVQNNVFTGLTGKPVIISTTGFMSLMDPHWANTFFNIFYAGTQTPQVPYNQVPYTKYENLQNILDDEPKYPKYNVVRNNVFHKSNDFWAWIRGYETNPNLTVADVTSRNEISSNWVTETEVGFVDEKCKNYSFKPDASVFTNISGFQNVPFEKMGRIK